MIRNIVQIAIDKCIEIHHFSRERFIAADVLYYVTDTDIHRILCQFREVMKEDVVLCANMHTMESTFLMVFRQRACYTLGLRQKKIFSRNPIIMLEV